MAALDFPDTPTVGQVFDKWTWNGTVWVLTAAAGSGARGRIAYAKVTANQTGTAGTLVDVTGLSVTWTADPTRTYQVTAVADLFSSVASDVGALYIFNTVGQVKRCAHSFTNAVNAAETFTVIAALSGLTGAQTYKAVMSRIGGSGTVSMYAEAINPASIMVEDTGP